MPIHDAHLRRTPYERLLPDPDFLDRHLAAIVAEAEERGVGLDDPGAFAMLEATAAAVDELRKPGADAGTTHTHAILLFHALHLERAGAPHRLVTTGAARWAVETEMAAAAATRESERVEPDAEAPAPTVLEGPAALYWQLPQHLFWVRVDLDEAPTSLDGVFRTATGDRLHVLGVMNVFDGAPGFDILPVPPAPLADLPSWASIHGRADDPDTADFASSMPGADLEGLYELRTVGELLKLVSRLERLARADGAVVPADSALDSTEGPAAADRRPSPSRLAYERLVLSS